MAKRSIRKNDPEDTSAPAARRRSTAGDAGDAQAAKPAARTRRKTAAPAEVAADATPVVVTAEFESVEEMARPVSDISHEQIALRAYHLYLERGGRPGDQLLDWVTAERELRERYSRARS